MRYLALLPLLVASLPELLAQVPTASLGPSTIRIGEPAVLTIAVPYRVDQGALTIEWPVVGDTLTAQIEVLRSTPVDTLVPDKEHAPYHHVQQRTITITAWDSGYWAIPPVVLRVNGKEQPTEALLLTVHTVPVDTTKAYMDIVDIYAAPYGWLDRLRDHWPWLAGGLGGLVAVLLLVRYLRRRARKPAQVPPVPEVPLEERTMAALRAIAARDLWRSGQAKAYHSAVTDVLRGYVEERFAVPAMERTTDELMQALRTGPVANDARQRLHNLLSLADLVKFAKYTASPTEHEELMTNAIAFVQETSRTHAPNS